MHTVELMERSLELAQRLGYQVREEWLGGSGGGGCEFGGRKWLFVDLALSVSEQLDQVLDALREDPRIFEAEVRPELRTLLGARRAA